MRKPRIVPDRAKPDMVVQYNGKGPSGGLIVTAEISHETFKIIQDIVSGKDRAWSILPQTPVNLAKRGLGTTSRSFVFSRKAASLPRRSGR